MASIYSLEHDVDSLESASEQWQLLAEGLAGSGEVLKEEADDVLSGSWTGEAADQYDQRNGVLCKSIFRAAELCKETSRLLSDTAYAVRQAQRSLESTFARVSDIPHSGSTHDQITWQPRDEADVERIRTSEAAANDVRNRLDTVLAQDADRLGGFSEEWATITGQST